MMAITSGTVALFSLIGAIYFGYSYRQEKKLKPALG